MAFWQTLLMVWISCTLAVAIGLPLGVLLLVTRRQHILPAPHINRIIAAIINIVRSIPFVILLIAIVPFTRLVTGASIGTIRFD